MYSPVPLGRIQYTMKIKTKPANVVKTKANSVRKNKVKVPRKTGSNNLFNQVVKNGAPLLGSAIGGYFGQPVLGGSLGSAVSRMLGCGDYEIKSNSLVPNARLPTTGAVHDSIIPTFSSNKNSVRVMEREYLGDVISSSSPGVFKIDQYPLNPTDSRTFPWLSRIANLFDQWEPNGIVFEFVSTSSSFSATQALGTVVMATNYNALNPIYPNKQVMENADFANSTKSSESSLHGVECSVDERPTKLLYTDLPNAVPPNFSILGDFSLASVGVPLASTNLGELWISYDITFYKKSLQGAPNPFFSASSNYISMSNPFGSPVYSSQNRLPISVTQIGTSSVFTWPDVSLNQQYMVEFHYRVEEAAFPSGTITLNGMVLSQSYKASNALNGYGIYQMWLLVTKTGATLTLPPISSIALTAIDFLVISVPKTLNTWNPA